MFEHKYNHRSKNQYLNNAVAYTDYANKRNPLLPSAEQKRFITKDELLEAFRLAGIHNFSTHQIELIGKGVASQALLASMLPASFHRTLYGALQRRIGHPVCNYEDCVIKVQPVGTLQRINNFTREAKLLSLINSRTYKDLRGSDIVPNLCYAGILFSGGQAHGMQVMTRAPGEILRNIWWRENGLTPEQYVIIEKALVSLWYLGFIHMDYHMQNIFFDTLTNKCTIIDLGTADIIPLEALIKLRQHNPLDVLQNTDQLFRLPGEQSFKHDLYQLNRLKQQVEDPSSIDHLRTRLWAS